MAKKAKYLDNKLFLKHLIKFKKLKDKLILIEELLLSIEDEDKIKILEKAKTRNLGRKKQVYDLIGVKFHKIGTKLLFSTKFINYTNDWKNEMYSEAMYNCVRYMHNFKTESATNPFSYFTTVIYNSFLQILNKEKKIKMQREVIRDKTLEELFPNGDMTSLKE